MFFTLWLRTRQTVELERLPLLGDGWQIYADPPMAVESLRIDERGGKRCNQRSPRVWFPGAIACDGSVEVFAEAAYARCQQQRPENSHTQHLRPQHTQARAL
jgi:hypothetical protein